jgi:hypothetical protein
VIVGAGLAGLAAATHLAEHGVAACVVESGQTVGGRVRTDIVDGFRLDRGFQLYNPAYPEGQRVLDHDALALKPFIAGAQVRLRKRRARIADPRRQPTWLIPSALAPLGSPLAEARFAAYALSRSRLPMAELEQAPDITAAQALREAGVDSALMNRLLRPFLGGVFLESELSTSRRFMDLVLRSFVRGTPSVPSLGMGEIPEQLARNLPRPVLLQTPVTEIRDTAVITEHGTIACRAVIIATDPVAAATFIPGFVAPPARSVTTWYHRVPDGHHLADGHAVLTLDGAGGGPLINSVVLTHAAPSYSADGETLVSSSALGVHHSGDIDNRVRTHLARLYDTDTRAWEQIAVYPIPYALPAMSVPCEIRSPVRLAPGRYVAGDHRDTASIQGALVSGRRAAQSLLNDFPDLAPSRPPSGRQINI